MNQAASIILWSNNIGYVLEEHQHLTVESPTTVRLWNRLLLECTEIEYISTPNFQWEATHVLAALIPWETSIGYYKDKFLVSVPSESVKFLQTFLRDELSYTDVLDRLKNLRHNAIVDVTQSSFELVFQGVTMYMPLNTFIKILGPSEIENLKKIRVPGLSFFQWEHQWVPLITESTLESKYIGIAQYHAGLWSLPLVIAPKLVRRNPAQVNNPLSHIVDLLQA